jgi:glycosyltransferase involved in cell wall biosynthesis/Flp pilus assembly protein TadD
MPQRPFVSLSMIVKNEEADLARCLDSVKGLVDEIVIVDTGSTDRTIEIARSYGATVHHFDWVDDFSAARNFALDHVTGEWVLHLDGDEVVVPSVDADAIRAELADNPAEVCFLRVPVRNPQPHGLGYDVYGARRLFRNRPDMRWRRPIHEAIHCVNGDRPEMDASCGSMVVDHDGYVDQQVRKARGKQTRNMRILKQWMSHTNEPVDYYYLAQEHSVVGQHPTALKLVKKAIKRFHGIIRPDFEGALCTAGMRYALHMGKYKEAVKLGLHGTKVYAYSEICYVLGCAYWHLEDYPQAERYLELAMALRSRVAEYQMEAGAGSWKALGQLGWVACRQNKMELGIERMRRAHEMAPEQPLTNLNYGSVLLSSDAAQAIPYLRRAAELAPTLPPVHLRLSQAMLCTGDTQAAYDHLSAVAAAQPQVAEYWQWLGELLLDVGEAEACVQVLGEAIATHQDRAPIYHVLGMALRRLGRYEDANNAMALAASLDPNSIGIRVGLALAHDMMVAVAA